MAAKRALEPGRLGGPRPRRRGRCAPCGRRPAARRTRPRRPPAGRALGEAAALLHRHARRRRRRGPRGAARPAAAARPARRGGRRPGRARAWCRPGARRRRRERLRCEGVDEIGDRRLRDRRRRRDSRPRGRGQQRQVAARGVADERDAAEVDPRVGDRAERRERRQHVVEQPGQLPPPPSRRYSTFSAAQPRADHVGRERVHQLGAVAGAPVAAVHERDDRERPVALGQRRARRAGRRASP